MEILKTTNEENKKFLKKKTNKIDTDSLTKEDKKNIRDTVKEMRRTMNKADGVGLSANQVGLEKRFFVAQIKDENNKPKFYSIFNPEIIKKSEETKKMMEGCLSIPDKHGIVERPKKVKIEHETLEGKRKTMSAWGILARVIQHEIDHLNGILFTDKADKVLTDKELKEFQKRNK
ncbi:MAG: peptide deformylase [Candidatus Magasanikbacteria bacterium]